MNNINNNIDGMHCNNVIIITFMINSPESLYGWLFVVFSGVSDKSKTNVVYFFLNEARRQFDKKEKKHENSKSESNNEGQPYIKTRI